MPDRVLVVDDELLIVDLLTMMLAKMGFEVCASAASATEAVMLAERYTPRLVLMDVRLRGTVDGIDAAMAIWRAVGSRIIFITGSREPETIRRIETAHPAPVLFKPIRFDQFRDAVLQVLA